jgi:hypothetical protein
LPIQIMYIWLESWVGEFRKKASGHLPLSIRSDHDFDTVDIIPKISLYENRGSAGANPIPIETPHPTLGCSIFCEIQEGGENAYPARQIIVRDLDGKHYSILITKKIKNARDLLKELKDRKLEHCTFVECWASAEEKELTEMLCKGVNVGISWSETTPYEMVTKTQFVATFTVNDGYFRTIAKIAFHYFLKHSPQFTGSETEFQAIKKFIMNGGDSDQYVKQGPGSFIYGLGHAVTTADRWGHLVAVDKSKRNIRAMLHFFVGPRIAPARYYEVYIERNPERIIYPQGIGHQFVYFDKPDGDGYGGRADPLLTASRKLML